MPPSFSRIFNGTSALVHADEVPLWGALVFVVYTVTALLGLQLDSVNTFAAPIWAPAGIALAAILLRGYTISSWVFAASVAVNLYTGAPIMAALLIGAGNTLEYLVGAYLILRFADPAYLFRRFRDTLTFIAVAYVMGIVGATIGVGALWLVGLVPQGEFVLTWLTWRMGDSLGVLVLVPFIVSWMSSYTYPVGSPREHVGETVALLGTLLAVNLLNFVRPFALPPSQPLLYLASLPLAWAAVRFGPRGVAIANLINLTIALVATYNGAGPFASREFLDGLFFLQTYIAVTSTTFLIFAAIMKEFTATRDALEQHVDELEYAVRKISLEDRAKADFLAELAHELRDPLAPVVSAIDFIRLKNPPDKEIQESIDIIQKQTSTMADLLNDLLDISRISRRKVSLSRKTLDLRSAIKSALGTAEPFMQTRKHRVKSSLGTKPLWVEADALRLEQIIVNLLNNAAKYTNPGGSISVSARDEREKIILTVTDNGIGLSKEILSRIFDPFQQFSGSGTRAAGLGIGLSLTKHLVELHRGTIEAVSAGTGKGARFTIKLPAAMPPAVPAETGRTQSELALTKPSRKVAVRTRKKHRILIVDDNERAAQSLAKLVERRGHTVRVAYDGASALKLASEFKPHIAILDIGMPRMDGYELARRLRETKRRMTLIALTGYGLEEDRKKALAAGFDQHLVKPVSITNLELVLH